MEKEVFKHPSYGMIRFTRTNGRAKFFGSELPQDHYIEMTLENAVVERDLSKEWYYAQGGMVARVRMSATQFAELITSLNIGSGVPCTIEFADKKRTEPLPEIEGRKEAVHRKFEERMQEFATRIKENQLRAKEIVKKKTLSKEDIHRLSGDLEFLTQEITSNIPYFLKCFQEDADKIVLEAKGEIESAILHKINTAGLSALHEQNKLLEEK